MVQDKEHIGILTLENFQLSYEDIGCDTLQIDVTGQGVLKYQEKITPELLLEINTNIATALTKYGKQTGHNPADIGYYFDLQRTKTYNREYYQGETEISLSIVFKKPVKNASAYSLTPTIKLITSILLGEIYIMKQSDKGKI